MQNIETIETFYYIKSQKHGYATPTDWEPVKANELNSQKGLYGLCYTRGLTNHS